MRFPIPRVASTIEVDRFFHEFYAPRRPVVIEGAAADWPATRRWTREFLRTRIDRAPERATRAPYWWDVDFGLVSEDVREPPLIAELRRRVVPRERQRSTRLWMSTSGDHTPWHYDGNCLEVFNVQVVGQKRFTLVSPETPIPLAPFSLMGARPDAPPASLLTDRHEHAVVELRPGNLLYLPRHWFHFVESLDAFNANVNWVWTDLGSGSLDHPVGIRERNLVGSLYPLFAAERFLARLGSTMGLPRLRVRHYTPEYTAEYGGRGDFTVARSFLRDRGWFRAYRTLLSELAVALYAAAGDRE
jgi:hypothetical protein